MNYDNLTVESIAQYCAEKSNFKINKADLESQIQHLINVKQAKQLILSGVGSSNDKKQLIEDLLECVNDATDTQTAMTGMTMCAMLMSEVIDQALTLTDVSQQRELLEGYNEYLEDYIDTHYLNDDIVENYLDTL